MALASHPMNVPTKEAFIQETALQDSVFVACSLRINVVARLATIKLMSAMKDILHLIVTVKQCAVTRFKLSAMTLITSDWILNIFLLMVRARL